MILKHDNALIAKCLCEFVSDNYEWTQITRNTRTAIPNVNNERRGCEECPGKIPKMHLFQASGK